MKDKMNQILWEYFGYSEFKTGQKAIIDQILSGQDVLGIMPTGAGKSICFQVPALMLSGTTIVVSPLISLMKDQVDTLNEMGIAAAFINSSLSLAEFRTVMDKAQKGEYKLLYIAPERLETESFWELMSKLEVALVAVDEAHCISEWGHDFRPSYTKIADMVDRLPKRPIVAAFTATATPEVKDDIIRLLKLRNPYLLITGFDRQNLYFEVDKPKQKLPHLLEYIKKNKQHNGVVYCSTRKTVDSVWEKLKKSGIAATRYHAGLTDTERIQNQEAFIYDRAQVIVATNAFGMGIDKSNIRYVVHYNMPKTMENYYQEAGRAGRDGEKSECILLFSPADTITNKLLIENSISYTDKSADYKKLQDMVDYCNTDGCLRTYILSYFGEQNAPASCGNCSNCLSNTEYTNITLEAQKILSCIKRTNERFGSGMIADVLRGANTSKLKGFGFDKLTVYGIMKEYTAETIKEIIAYLIAEGYIAVKGDKYPLLGLSPKAYELLKGEEELFIKRLIAKAASKKAESAKEIDETLFEKLRTLRREIAEKQKVPPFVVFSDAAIKDMCSKLPVNDEEMLAVSGVGKFKMEKYGAAFIALIKQHMSDNNIEISLPEPEIEVEVEEPKRRNTTKEPKKDTRQATYELYVSGKTIEEICLERDMTRQTIEGHLIDCLDKGLELDYQAFIPAELEPQIMGVIEACGGDRLKAIKEALPAEVSYTAIKFALWKYKQTR